MKTLERIAKHTGQAMAATKNIALRAMDIPLKPRWLVFMTTDRCNSRCAHCNIWQQEGIAKPLTPQEIKNIFSDALFKNVEYVLCTGGEPTVRSDLIEVFLALHSAMPKARLQLSTNGLLPDRVLKLANVMMENNVAIDVGVSLDGIGPKHDSIRGISGNFEKADRLLRELVKMRTKFDGKLGVAAGIVLSDLTIDTVKSVREYACRMNIEFVEAWYNTATFYHNCNEQDKAVMKERMLEIVRSQGSSPLQEKWLKWLEGEPIKFPCFAMNSFFVVKCNGDVVPCLTKWDAKAGNIRDTSPAEFWRSGGAGKVRKIVRNCEGCLNTWGAGWSFACAYYPVLFYYLKHPLLLIEKIKGSRG